MATRKFTHPGRALSIKTILVTTTLVLGGITLAAFLAGVGRLNSVYGLLGVVLLVQAAFYAIL